VKVYASDRHRLHDPEHEIEAARLQPPFEHPGRAETIRAALGADDRFEIAEPAVRGTAPIEAVHDTGLVRFLGSAWEDYQREVHPSHDVVPDVFALPGLRHGMGTGPGEPSTVAARLGWWCFETTTPVTAGSYDAARSGVDCALAAADAVLGGERVAYGLCRPPGHHAARSLYGGYCFFNNAGVAAAHVVAATSSGAGRGTGSTCNLPLPVGTDDDAYLVALDRALATIDAFDPAVVVVSLGVDTLRRGPDVRPRRVDRGLRAVRAGRRRPRASARRTAGGRLRRRRPRCQRGQLAGRGYQLALSSSTTARHRSGSLRYGA
jgi:acetoin utilization deacetylase AcuC-like enzyme